MPSDESVGKPPRKVGAPSSVHAREAPSPTVGSGRAVSRPAQFTVEQPTAPPTESSSRKSALAPVESTAPEAPTRVATMDVAVNPVAVCTLAEREKAAPAPPVPPALIAM